MLNVAAWQLRPSGPGPLDTGTIARRRLEVGRDQSLELLIILISNQGTCLRPY